MTFRLRSIVANLGPSGLLGYKLVKLVLKADFGIERICGNRKTVVLRENFT